MSNSSTSELLFWCLSIQTRPESLNYLDFDDFDWVYFLRQVHYHRVSLLVESKLRSLGDSVVPKFVFDALSQSISKSKRRLILLQFGMLNIAEILKNENIPAIFFKGPTLSKLVYGSFNQRIFDDLDFWVHEKDYIRVREVFIQRGYLSLDYPTLSVEEANRFRHYAGEYTLVHPNGEICLDVHSRLLGGANLGFVKNFDKAWDRTISLSVSNREVTTLCPEDLLIYLSLNGLKDGWQSLRAICDIDRLIRNFPEIDWDSIIRETRKSRSSRALHISLLLANKLLETPLPPLGIASSLSNASKAEQITDYIYNLLISQIDNKSERNPISSFRIVWSASNHWSDRISFLLHIPVRFWRLLTAINSHDTTIAVLPKFVLFLYYPIRIVRVVKSHGFSILEILLK